MNRVHCPNCACRLKFDNEHAGKKAQCQKCRHLFRLPSLAPDSARQQSDGRQTKAETDFSGDPDVQLMLRVQQGDQAAFSQLVVNYQERLVGVMSPLLDDRDAVDDLVQEVFLRIYRARHRYEPTARFATWLFRIANNLVRNLRRDSGRRKKAIDLDAYDPGLSHVIPFWGVIAEKSGEMPTRKADKSELCSTVRAALTALNDQQRMAVLLHHYEQMSYSDIAAALDMQPSAVKSLIVRAHKKLRGKLEPYVERGAIVPVPKD